MPATASDPAVRAGELGLDPARLPRHVAVIMDGNGRWAASRGLPRLAGHKAGVDSVRELVRVCGELGIPALTLYAFSTENWRRSEEEVGGLMELLAWALKSEALALDRNNVRLRAIGRTEDLPGPVVRELESSIAALRKNTGLTLTLALNYGGRQEIVDAVNRLVRRRGHAAPEQPVTEEEFAASLSTAGLPELDLVVRTSGEQRLSNFLLWQAAYAEFVVVPELWPEFRTEAFARALKEFQGRLRRFGGA